MSVYAEDLLKLPSLLGAEVIAGRGGLRKVISSISVLETVDSSVFSQAIFPNDDVKGSELVITGFINSRDDANVQLETVKYLCRLGEAGLILFYVGVYVREVDQRIIDYANENDFLIICMPRNDPSLMYSDVIRDVMTVIVRDQITGEAMTNSILERISREPEHQEKLVSSELVKAILKDDPFQMRRLASILKIDIASVHNTFVFSGADYSEKHAGDIGQLASQYCNTAFADIYDTQLVLFTSDFKERADMESFMRSALEQLPQNTRAGVYTNQKSTTDVRRDFVMNRLYIVDTRTVLPNRKVYYSNDLQFVQQCRKMIDSGELSVMSATSVLDAFDDANDAEELKDTLAVYLLDTDRSVQLSSELLFVHKNTVKYRLKVIADKLGYPPGEMPGSFILCVALAVRRLISG